MSGVTDELAAYMAASEAAPRHPPTTLPLRDLAADPDWQWVQGQVDPGIRAACELLRQHWFETDDSCEGGPGHAEAEPQIAFGPGDESTGPLAWKLLTDHGFQVKSMELHRWYCPDCDEVSEPEWIVVFHRAPASPALRDTQDGAL